MWSVCSLKLKSKSMRAIKSKPKPNFVREDLRGLFVVFCCCCNKYYKNTELKGGCFCSCVRVVYSWKMYVHKYSYIFRLKIVFLGSVKMMTKFDMQNMYIRCKVIDILL